MIDITLSMGVGGAPGPVQGPIARAKLDGSKLGGPKLGGPTLGGRTRRGRTLRGFRTRHYEIFRPGRVRRLVERVDRLKPFPRGHFMCPMIMRAFSPTLTLQFRARRGGAPLAELEAPAAFGSGHGSGAGVCDPIHFQIHGGTPLALLSDNLVAAVGKLAGWNIS